MSSALPPCTRRWRAAVASAGASLRGLGMDYDEAAEVARRPLPPLRVELPTLPRNRRRG